MKSIFKTTITLSVLLTTVVGCNNTSETSTDNKDSVTSPVTNTANDTSSRKNNMSMDTGMMSSMSPTMDRIKNMKMTGDFDIDFANTMIEHHQGAIDMAQTEISQGKDEKMKSKAQEIINKQKDEQQKLRDFVGSYKPSGMKHAEGELQKSMSEMMDKMKSMQMSGDTDRDFAVMMVSHHEHGVAMSKMELKNGMSDKLKQMAKKIIDDQQKDITEFRGWLNNHK